MSTRAAAPTCMALSAISSIPSVRNHARAKRYVRMHHATCESTYTHHHIYGPFTPCSHVRAPLQYGAASLCAPRPSSECRWTPIWLPAPQPGDRLAKPFPVHYAPRLELARLLVAERPAAKRTRASTSTTYRQRSYCYYKQMRTQVSATRGVAHNMWKQCSRCSFKTLN